MIGWNPVWMPPPLTAIIAMRPMLSVCWSERKLAMHQTVKIDKIDKTDKIILKKFKIKKHLLIANCLKRTVSISFLFHVAIENCFRF